MEETKEINLLKILLYIILTIAVVIGMVFFIRSGMARGRELQQQRLEAQAAQEAADAAAAAAEAAFRADILHKLESRVDPASVTGNKAIAVVYEDTLKNKAVFNSEYVPESYRTEDPSQVRYIIRIVKDKDMVGTYTNGGGFAWKYHFYLTLIDLKEEAMLHSEDMFGGDPPATVTSKDGFSHTGSEPSLERITAWAQEKIQLGVTEESERLWITVHANIPDSWPDPFCAATDDDWGVFGEDGTKNGIASRKMKKDGDWYVVDVPNWTETVRFYSNPELSDPKTSEDTKIYGDDDLWLIVSETDGSVRKDRDAAKANQ